MRNKKAEASYSVMAVTLFGKKEVARYQTFEQAEHQAKELNEHSERNSRGYVCYSVRKVRQGSLP
jgi:hypothetical protein